VQSAPKKHPRLQLKKDRKESIRRIAAVVPRYSNQEVPQPTRKNLSRGGLFEYLFREFFLKSPILTPKRGV
jgi:hypothetical protein